MPTWHINTAHAPAFGRSRSPPSRGAGTDGLTPCELSYPARSVDRFRRSCLQLLPPPPISLPPPAIGGLNCLGGTYVPRVQAGRTGASWAGRQVRGSMGRQAGQRAGCGLSPTYHRQTEDRNLPIVCHAWTGQRARGAPSSLPRGRKRLDLTAD